MVQIAHMLVLVMNMGIRCKLSMIDRYINSLKKESTLRFIPESPNLLVQNLHLHESQNGEVHMTNIRSSTDHQTNKPNVLNPFLSRNCR